MNSAIRSRDGSVHVTDERFNTLSHLVAFCFSVLGTVLLVSQAIDQGDPWKIYGFSIYGLALMTLCAASTLCSYGGRAEGRTLCSASICSTKRTKWSGAGEVGGVGYREVAIAIGSCDPWLVGECRSLPTGCAPVQS